ncbi:hypothetical protein CFFPNG_00523 [Methylorubrum aminovorans]|nr:hypothetical protein BY998_109101 [Methylobacterium sp. B4]
MHGYEDVAISAAGEERDALWRALAEDLAEASGRARGPSGFVQAERPADLARALGRGRRAKRGRASAALSRAS